MPTFTDTDMSCGNVAVPTSVADTMTFVAPASSSTAPGVTFSRALVGLGAPRESAISSWWIPADGSTCTPNPVTAPSVMSRVSVPSVMPSVRVSTIRYWFSVPGANVTLWGSAV